MWTNVLAADALIGKAAVVLKAPAGIFHLLRLIQNTSGQVPAAAAHTLHRNQEFGGFLHIVWPVLSGQADRKQDR